MGGKKKYIDSRCLVLSRSHSIIFTCIYYHVAGATILLTSPHPVSYLVPFTLMIAFLNRMDML